MPIRLTPTVKYLLFVCIGAFVVQQTVDRFMGGNVTGMLGLVPYGFVVQHRLWQILTYLFLHGDVMHLVLNMLMLFFVGGEIESVWGRWRFLRYYAVCGVAAGILYLLLQVFLWGGSSMHTPMVGASGAIYGLLVAYGILFGERTLLFMMLFPMKAKHFVWILMGVELLSSLFSGRGGLSSAAHLGGMVAGFLYLWTVAIWVRTLREGERPPKRRGKKGGHLKLVSSRLQDEENDEGPKTWH